MEVDPLEKLIKLIFKRLIKKRRNPYHQISNERGDNTKALTDKKQDNNRIL